MKIEHVKLQDLRPGMFVVGLETREAPRDHRDSDWCIGEVATRTRIREWDTEGYRGAWIDKDRPIEEVEEEPTESAPAAMDTTNPASSVDLGEEDVCTTLVPQDVQAAQAVQAHAMQMVQAMFDGVKTGAPIKNQDVREVVDNLITSVFERRDAMLLLTTMSHAKGCGEQIVMHAVNCCVLTIVVAKLKQWSPAVLQQVAIGALLHDIGELWLPQNLLNKAEAYTQSERRLMRKHPTVGRHEVRKVMEHVDIRTLRIIEEHHERVDGSGYPHGLTWESIDGASQLVGLIDYYEGLLTARGTRPALPPAQAIQRIFQSSFSPQWDPSWAQYLVASLGIYPVGSLVKFDTGEIAVVMGTRMKDRLRPIVRLVEVEAGQPVSIGEEIDLAEAGQTGYRKIVATLQGDSLLLDLLMSKPEASAVSSPVSESLSV